MKKQVWQSVGGIYKVFLNETGQFTIERYELAIEELRIDEPWFQEFLRDMITQVSER